MATGLPQSMDVLRILGRPMDPFLVMRSSPASVGPALAAGLVLLCGTSRLIYRIASLQVRYIQVLRTGRKSHNLETHPWTEAAEKWLVRVSSPCQLWLSPLILGCVVQGSGHIAKSTSRTREIRVCVRLSVVITGVRI